MNDSDNDNGSPVTAEDVAYVINIAEDLNAQTRAAGLGEIIEITSAGLRIKPGKEQMVAEILASLGFETDDSPD